MSNIQCSHIYSVLTEAEVRFSEVYGQSIISFSFNNACHCMYTMLFYLTLETATIVSAAHKVYEMLAII